MCVCVGVWGGGGEGERVNTGKIKIFARPPPAPYMK